MFYLFHGDDAHTQKETLANLLAKLGDPGLLELNTTRFSGLVTLPALRQACDALPFLAPARVVVVSDLFAAKPGKPFLDELAAYLPTLPEKTRLVFLEVQTLPASHALVKAAREAKNGYEKCFERPQGAQLERWILQRATQKNGRISPRAANLLATNIGSDLQILDQELEKLALYKGVGGEETAVIDVHDVNLLSPYVAEASIFDLVDALGNRNAKKASLLLQQKFDEGADPLFLFSMFVRQFRLLIQVKELADAGLNAPAIAQKLRLHGFVAGKLLQQSRGFSLPQLEQIYRHLLEIDVAAKTGAADLLTALTLLVANLTLAA